MALEHLLLDRETLRLRMHQMALRTRVAREARFLILGFGLGGGSSNLPMGANDAVSERIGHRLQI